jgi:hypothetical protein
MFITTTLRILRKITVIKRKLKRWLFKTDYYKSGRTTYKYLKRPVINIIEISRIIFLKSTIKTFIYTALNIFNS